MEPEVDILSETLNHNDSELNKNYSSQSNEHEKYQDVVIESSSGDDNRNFSDLLPPKCSEDDLSELSLNYQNNQESLELKDYLDAENLLKGDNTLDLVANTQNEYQKDNNDNSNKDTDEVSDELPEGWVRCGHGLKAEFLNTPKSGPESNLESRNLFMNFTNGQGSSNSKVSLHQVLMNLDRSAVKELRGGFVAVKANRPQYTKYELNNRDYYPLSNSLPNGRRSNTGYSKVFFENDTKFQVNSTKLVNSGYPKRNNTFSNTLNDFDLKSDLNSLKEIENLKCFDTLNDKHQKELENTSQTLLCHVEDLVKKYRELAIDAVNAARNEQLRCQEECRQAYSTAYNACVKYEKDLKNTIKYALKEYQNNHDTSLKNNYYDNFYGKSSFKGYHDNLKLKSLNDQNYKENLCSNYKIDKNLLNNFESNVFKNLNLFIKKYELELKESFNFTKNDSNQYLKSLISNYFI